MVYQQHSLDASTNVGSLPKNQLAHLSQPNMQQVPQQYSSEFNYKSGGGSTAMIVQQDTSPISLNVQKRKIS